MRASIGLSGFSLTGGKEMTNNTPMGTSHPNFRLEENEVSDKVLDNERDVYWNSHCVTGVNQCTICLW